MSEIRLKYTSTTCLRIYCLRRYGCQWKKIAACFGLSIHQVRKAYQRAISPRTMRAWDEASMAAIVNGRFQ